MLSASELCSRLREPDDSEDRLAIVPLPNLKEVEKRAAASIDLRLGRWFMNFKQTRRSAVSLANVPAHSMELEPKTRQHFVRFGEGFTIHPGRFVLGVTFEWVRIPGNLSAQILGRSSLGRHGLIIETASGVHPNFSGCLTLEIANVGEVPLRIYPGMEIAQLFLFSINQTASKNLGSFSGSRKPSAPKMKPDRVLSKLSENPD